MIQQLRLYILLFVLLCPTTRDPQISHASPCVMKKTLGRNEETYMLIPKPWPWEVTQPPGVSYQRVETR